MSSQKRPEWLCLKVILEEPRKTPQLLSGNGKNAAFSSFTAPNNHCHLMSPPLSSTRTALVNIQGMALPWLSLRPPSSQLYLLLSSTADGSLVTFSYYCHSAGRSISNNCSLHASSSMYLAALSLNYSSDHLSLAHSHPFLCFKGQSQMSFSYLQTEVKLHLFLIS